MRTDLGKKWEASYPMGKEGPELKNSQENRLNLTSSLVLDIWSLTGPVSYPSWPSCGQVVRVSVRKKRSSRPKLSGNLKPKTPHAIHKTNTEGLKHPAADI